MYWSDFGKQLFGIIRESLYFDSKKTNFRHIRSSEIMKINKIGRVFEWQIFSMVLFLLGISSYSNAQITVEDYPREVRCSVEELPLVHDVKATSSAGAVYSRTEEQIFSGGCMGTMVRTYYFTDDAGNTATAEQYIFLSDERPPVLIGVPEDITVAMNAIPPPANVDNRDNSGAFYVVYFKEVKEDGRIVRTWSCEDQCGNMATATQVITLISE